MSIMIHFQGLRRFCLVIRSRDQRKSRKMIKDLKSFRPITI